MKLLLLIMTLAKLNSFESVLILKQKTSTSKVFDDFAEFQLIYKKNYTSTSVQLKRFS